MQLYELYDLPFVSGYSPPFLFIVSYARLTNRLALFLGTGNATPDLPTIMMERLYTSPTYGMCKWSLVSPSSKRTQEHITARRVPRRRQEPVEQPTAHGRLPRGEQIL